ncbi:MAG: response regulator [Candidatus Omnitrophica bacterium]|nr:response regulator [Candidatus Omnitrophota bacterium]MDE2222355.1 response regulator [Candidatus Omnitrophota bacterium]
MNLLIAEDNEPEQVIIKEAFQEAGVEHDLYFVRDGIEALEFLKSQDASHPLPAIDLVLLDLNMPRKNGLEVLSEIKRNSKWAHVPVLVLSNSEFPKDIRRCYDMGANAYINKPVDFEDFVGLARAINLFWLKLVRPCPN